MGTPKKYYRYLFAVGLQFTNGEFHKRLHVNKKCRFAAALMGYDMAEFRKGTSSYDDDRCDACHGFLRERPIKG